jgi:hypothetical protein
VLTFTDDHEDSASLPTTQEIASEESRDSSPSHIERDPLKKTSNSYVPAPEEEDEESEGEFFVVRTFPDGSHRLVREEVFFSEFFLNFRSRIRATWLFGGQSMEKGTFPYSPAEHTNN